MLHLFHQHIVEFFHLKKIIFTFHGYWLWLCVADLGLRGVDEPVHVAQGLAEPLEAVVQLVVAVEADGEAGAADQREEGEAAADGPRLALLQHDK